MNSVSRVLVMFFVLACSISISNVYYFYISNVNAGDTLLAQQLTKFSIERNVSARTSLKGAVLDSPNKNNDEKQSLVSLASEEETKHHKVAGLSCEKYGGPMDKTSTDEMVYWNDIPSDAGFVSPFRKSPGAKKKYLTFEPDEGGWNNLRMSMETAVATAHAMGRILVMPPLQEIYLLQKKKDDQKKEQTTKFSFADFFHFESVAMEHSGVEIITTQEFLEREIMTGNIKNAGDSYKSVLFPPQNRTNWDGAKASSNIGKTLTKFLREIAVSPKWSFERCIAVFPKEPGANVMHLHRMRDEIIKEDNKGKSRWEQFNGNPTPVDAPTKDRMREALGSRQEICLYGDKLQKAPLIHFQGDNASGARMLVHFYALLFFDDWKQDLWTKRFVRDHFRYIDEIQCAAARIIEAVREIVKGGGTSKKGLFDTFHIRRGDFQYKQTRVEASVIYENTVDLLLKDNTADPGMNSTIYIATDERNKEFFDPLRKHHNLLFLDDFIHLLKDVNTNYYGMLDQLISSRGEKFFGTYFSTFTGYIQRMRGYHSQKQKLDGYQEGRLKSYYFIPKDRVPAVTEYTSVQPPLWAREFPVGWRDLDKGIDN